MSGGFVARLRGHVERQPTRPALTFLGPGGAPEVSYDYAGLDAAARAVAAAVQAHARPGDRALLLYPPGAAYAVAFLGCLYAGVLAVPVYLPRGDKQLPRLAAIVQDATPALALTTAPTLARAGTGLAALLAAAGVAVLATEALPAEAAASWEPPTLGPAALAFLQYTSGSTGRPRGVCVSHGNLLANSALIYEAFGHGPESLALTWVPPYHDMGLIGGLLQPLYGGFPGVSMSPLAFLKHPMGWLQAVSRYGATTSGGPDFGYALCAERVRPGDLDGLDLSAWRLAFDGAEPVRRETLARFAEAFAPAGFRPEAFFPCYGLAEATLIVSGGHLPALAGDGPVPCGPVLGQAPGGGPPGDGPRADAGPPAADGPPARGHAASVRDPETGAPLPPGAEGEVWVRGPSVAAGYWGPPALSAGVFDAGGGAAGPGWLRTGDLGRLDRGILTITGRLKDLIIVAGRNAYPQDLEYTASRCHPALRPDGAAAFAVPAPDTADGVAVVVVVEASRAALAEPAGAGADAEAAVRRAIAAEHDLALAHVVLIGAGTLPRTSSGKVRRAATREAFSAGAL